MVFHAKLCTVYENKHPKSLLKANHFCFADREEEESDYILWLKGKKAKLVGGEQDLAGLKSIWTAPDLDPDEAFLKDYILNKRYMDRAAMK